MINRMLSKNKGYAQVGMNKSFKINSVDDKFWLKCTSCNENIFRKDVEDNFNVCPKCNYHFSFSSRDRVNLIMDENTFEEFDIDLESKNILDFPEYDEKLEKYKSDTKEKEAVITGTGNINGIKAVLCVMNAKFMMGSMGFIVGEKISNAIDYAINEKLPVIIASASGGARMQEGIISLMQMAKISAVLKKFSENSGLYISLITNPTTGGVTASFAMLGDIIISEPNALIGFAGPRVIEQTIKQNLPDGFQSSEFLLEHGFLDMIVSRKDLKDKLYKLLKLHSNQGGENYESIG